MDEINYNVKTFINKENNNKENIEKIFNQKLIKVILLLEKKVNCCQE